MVVIAILGILSAIALPSYTEYVKRTRRTAVQEQMLQIQQLMERYRSPRDTYVGADTNALPQSGLSRYPTDTSQAELYRLVVSPPALTQTTYTITATRAGAMVDDECGNFTLNSIGQRAVVDNSGGRTLATCWPQ